MRVAVRGDSVSLSEHIVDVNEATFGDEVLQRSFDVPVVVDFWAPWCAPCRTLGPILERAAIEAGGAFRLARVNVDDNPQLSIRFGVQGIPAVKAFRQGEVVSEFVGAQPEPVVHRFLERVAPAEVDAGLVRALGLQAARHWAKAEAAFRDVLAREETNPAASLGLVECLLMQARGQQAKAALVDFPPSTEWATAEKLRPLAEWLARAASLEPADPDDPLETQYLQAGRLIGLGNLEAAMDGLLDVLRSDKDYRGGQARLALLGLFALLGDEDRLTRAYREELASILF
jgi:putative thioredoxin